MLVSAAIAQPTGQTSGKATSPRFGASSNLLELLPPERVEQYFKLENILGWTRVVTSPIEPVTSFVLKELVGDQLHQHRALKDAYEILLPKDLKKVSFDQIIGHDKAKRELQEFINRQQFAHLFEFLYKGDERGANNAVLLTGPAGTGKTLLAKAVAANTKDAAMVNVHCETLNRMLQQQNAARKFEMRLKNLPQKRIVILFDEMEVIGNRGSLKTSQAEYKTLTWLLKTMDGMKTLKNKELLIIGTTNHPENIDTALRNRFAQIIPVKAPKRDEVKQLYQLYLNRKEKRLQLKGSLDLDTVVDASKDFTGRKVEQAVSILKRNLLLELPNEKKAELTQKIIENRKGLFKKPEPLDIKLEYTQNDLLKAVHMARSGLDLVQVDSTFSMKPSKENLNLAV